MQFKNNFYLFTYSENLSSTEDKGTQDSQKKQYEYLENPCQMLSYLICPEGFSQAVIGTLMPIDVNTYKTRSYILSSIHNTV